MDRKDGMVAFLTGVDLLGNLELRKFFSVSTELVIWEMVRNGEITSYRAEKCAF